jgi:muramoyltetrapeptide carboxypeptidase
VVLGPEEPALVKPLVRPRRLVPGDLIGVAALSGPSDPGRLESGCRQLESFGYRTVLAPNVRERSGTLGLAGDDRSRLEGYRSLLLDPAVKAIFFARGGYGAGRILPLLDPREVVSHPKLHCGFSDLTALHAFLATRCGLLSFHGPMVAADLADPLDPLTARYFPSLLEGGGPREIPLQGAGAEVIVSGNASGRLVGGCLSMLVSLIGTPDEFDYDGALLFLEDVAEEAYRIDRMIGTLQRAGRMDRLAGVLIGSFARITFGGAEQPGRLSELFRERFARLGVPVASGLPAGHRGPNLPLPIGGEVTWDGERRVLRFDEEVVT